MRPWAVGMQVSSGRDRSCSSPSGRGACSGRRMRCGGKACRMPGSFTCRHADDGRSRALTGVRKAAWGISTFVSWRFLLIRVFRKRSCLAGMHGARAEPNAVPLLVWKVLWDRSIHKKSGASRICDRTPDVPLLTVIPVWRPAFDPAVCLSTLRGISPGP